MDFSISKLLTNFADDKLVAPKVLEKKLNCDDEDSLRKLQIALDALERIGILTKDRGRYRRVKEDDVIEGKLRCSSKGFCFAIQDIEGADDIYVRESQLNTAWNGDRVLVRVTKEGSRRRSPEGEVRLILERSNHSVLARVKKVGSAYRAVPLDDRLLFELDLQAEDGDNAKLEEAVDQLVHVEIQRYPLGQNRPLGRIAQILGSDAEAASDIDIVCCKYDLPRDFPAPVLKAAKALPQKPRKAAQKNRLDLRKLTTVSIVGSLDPDHPVVVDDALTLEYLAPKKKSESPRWQVGVHIADVSHYVPFQSDLDLEAQRRGTSIYLGSSVLHMLPEHLHQCCALTPGEDRLAISVLLTLDGDGTLQEFEIQPTLINVDYQIDYQHVETILRRNQPPEAEEQDTPYPLLSEDQVKQYEPIFEFLDQLFQLSTAVQNQRHDRGCFELNLPEQIIPQGANSNLGEYLSPKFQYDDEGALGAMVVSSLLPSRSLVTEFMLLANQAVATHLQALELPGVYRIHRTPDPNEVQELLKLVSNMGIESDLTELDQDEDVHPRQYRHLTQEFANSKVEKVLTYLLLSTLRPASYSTHAGPHFGLALEDGYTHFTSPMRRYPDLLVHRVLHTMFDHGRDRRSTRAKEQVKLRHSSCHQKVNWNVIPPEMHTELADHFASVVLHLSEREKLAQDAEADLEGLKKAEFMQQHTGEVFHGLITGVQSYGFFVEIEELLVEGLVHVSSLKDDWYEYRSRQQKLVGRKSRRQYRLGDRVEVQVKSVDYYRQQIDLVAVGGGSEAQDDDLDDDPDLDTDRDDRNGDDYED